MEELAKIIELAERLWEETLNTLCKSLEALRSVISKRIKSTPKKYGESLKKAGRKRPFKKYSYFEIQRKNEPYQRRNYDRR